MKYSIIIPTYNKCDELLRPCIDSILKYTTVNDLSTAEIVVVANGCTDNTREYIQSLQGGFHGINLVWFDEPLGFTKATNEGIKVAKGDYLVFLNNDTVLLDQPYNQWLEILNKPFQEDKTVGVSGPMKEYCPHGKGDFVLFFCAMLSKELIDKVGLLDEIFSPGIGEDCDMCFRAVEYGFKVVQVPDDTRQFYDVNKRTGNFPIWHAGTRTFANWEGGEELIRRNSEILANRWGSRSLVDKMKPAQQEANEKIAVFQKTGELFLNIEDAKKCDGFMSDMELYWLAAQAAKSQIIIEVGSWHGKSSRALADNMPGGAKLYCVDHWAGSATERESNHASAKWNDGDHAFIEFSDNLADHIKAGRVIPIRMSSKNAAAWFKKHGIKADMVFIDAGHTYEEVKEDILLWTELCEKTFCGHDYQYTDGMWEGVTRAVDELVEARRPQGTNIWVATETKKKLLEIQDSPKVVNEKVNIYDCFPMNGELDILEIRFNELDNIVDRWVIVESLRTHQNNPKPLYFRDNLERFEKFLHKVTHIVVSEFPAIDSWSLERFQRDSIMRGLTECKDNDIIIISDIDEIPNSETVKNYRPEEGIKSLEQTLYYYNFNCKAKDIWREGKILPYRVLKSLSPCGARYSTCEGIPNAGWHFSYFGNIDKIIKKIEDSAHIEYNKEEFKDREKIRERIKGNEDIFGRNLVYEYVEIDENYPNFVRNNIEKFVENGMICQEKTIQEASLVD